MHDASTGSIWTRHRTPPGRWWLFVALSGLAACRTAASPTPGGPESTGSARAEVFSPDTISDQREQWRLTFAPDRRTVFYAASDSFFPVSRRATIMTSRLVGGHWSRPEVAPFSGEHSDMDPFVTPDGRSIYFSSIRPNATGRRDLDIWMVARVGSGWSEPVRLGPEVNSADDELYPSLDRAGNLYFASGPLAPRRGEHFDIYRSASSGGRFQQRERLSPSVNTRPEDYPEGGPQAAWEFNPEISADGRMLVFTSLRPGGFGIGDLYVSHRVAGAWTPARNLGPGVNTAADEYHPTVSRRENRLYFIRRTYRPWVDGDFYHVPLDQVAALRPPGSEADARVLRLPRLRIAATQDRGAWMASGPLPPTRRGPPCFWFERSCTASRGRSGPWWRSSWPCPR
jgi:Tol biopolymer transport system component